MRNRSKRQPPRAKVTADHARLRREDPQPIQISVPDVTSPEFAEEASRQSRLAAASPTEADDQAFIDSISDIKI
jgi:Protein  of unknown function (DUF3018)